MPFQIIAHLLQAGWGYVEREVVQLLEIQVCYGRLTVLSDLDGWGVVLKSSNKSGVNAVLYRRKYN
jgi:hypothetical protein